MIKKYEKYTITKNFWYPEIPAHWITSKLKYVAKTIAGGTPSTNKIEYWENGDIPWLPSGKLQNCEITSAEKFITKDGFINSSSKWIKPNTTLIALTGATCANIGYLKFHACANQSVIAIDEFADKANSRFLFYMLLSMRRQILSHQSGGAQAGINDGNVKNLFLLIPPRCEQSKITQYLDHQTKTIDQLIQQKEKLIQLLKEKRQAVINEAVTKGLNSNTKMKDSGIEWLGEIPNNWTVVKSKFITSLITDGAHISPDLSSADFPFVSTVDLNKGEIDWDNCLKTSKECYDYLVNNGCKPLVNDILYSKDGTIGKTTVIDEEKDFVVASSLIIARPDLSKINPFYFEYLLRSYIIQFQIESLLSGVALRRISLQKFSNLILVVPPLEDQNIFLNTIHKDQIKFKRALAKLKEQIKLLKEYRQSIIFEAVTGKIDVREWQANKQQTA